MLSRAVSVLLVCILFGFINSNAEETTDRYNAEQEYNNSTIRDNEETTTVLPDGLEMDTNMSYTREKSVFCFINGTNIRNVQQQTTDTVVDVQNELSDFDNFKLEKCTHLVVGAYVDDRYSIKGIDLQFQRKIISELKSKYSKLKILLSVYIDPHIFKTAATSSIPRNRLVTRIVNFVTDGYTESQFDGLVIDSQFPTQDSLDSATNNSEYIAELIKNLKAFLKNKLLAITIPPAIQKLHDDYRFQELVSYVDYFIIMATDYHGHQSETIYSAAPIRSHDGFNIESTIDAVIQAVGLDKAEKLILAVSFYGKRYHLYYNLDKGESPIGQTFRNHRTPYGSGIVLYKYSCVYKNSPARGSYYWRYGWDGISQTPWLINDAQAILYEDEQSVREKAKLALKKGLGGVITYSLNMDDYEGRCAATQRRSYESNHIQRGDDGYSKLLEDGKSPLLQAVYDVIGNHTKLSEEEPDQTTLGYDQTNTRSYDETNVPNYEQTTTSSYDNLEPTHYTSPKRPLKSIFCYVNASYFKNTEYGQLDLTSEEYENCTHLVVDGAYLDRNCNLMLSYVNFEILLSDMTDKYKSLQVLLSVSGDHAAFKNMSRTPHLRSRFIHQAAYVMGDNTSIYNGIVIDWQSGIIEESQYFVELMEELKNNVSSDYKKSLAIILPPSVEYLYNGYRFDRFLYTVDYFIIMAMEYYDRQVDRILPNAPIHSQDFENGRFSVENTVDNIVKAIGPNDAYRLILAIPFFGYRYELYNELGRGESPIGKPFQGNGRAWSNIVTYKQACLYKNSPTLNGRFWRYGWDSKSKTPWLVNGHQAILYEDRLSVRRKAALAFDQGKGLGGVMLYRIEMDDFDGECTAAQRLDSRYWIKPNDAKSPLLKAVYDVIENGLTPAERMSV